MSRMRIWSAWAASAGMAIAVPVNAQNSQAPAMPQAATQATVTLPAAPPPDGGTVPGLGADPVSPDVTMEEARAFLAVQQDRTDRFTIPIQIDGKGPYRFIIDTGAQRTIISRELAKMLALPAHDRVKIVSIGGMADVDTVSIGNLTYGNNNISDIRAPVLLGNNLGALGLLGVDSLQSKRLIISFPSGKMEIAKGRGRRTDPDAIVVEARSRFGQLVLVDATAGGQKVHVILDTGAQHSIGNLALYRKLSKRNRLPTDRPIAMTSVTGQQMIGQWGMVDKITLGGVVLQGVGMVFMDAAPFDVLELGDKPALLLGMDVLSGFKRVEVDFARKSVNFLINDSALQPPARLAMLGEGRH